MVNLELKPDSNRQPGFVMGIDPGFFGALAVYDPAAKSLKALIGMPLKRKTGASRTTVDNFQLALFFDEWANQCKYAIIEEVNAMPGQGVSSMFRFGESYGTVLGVIAAYYMPHLRVSPWTWKMLMGCSKDKNISVKKARELFPSHTQYFEQKKQGDGFAEAALMAVYGSLYTFRSIK